MKLKIKKLIVKKDTRGWLSEIVRPEDIDNPQFGQVLVTTANKGEIKGKHYHKRKTEWYCIIHGNGMLTITDNKTKEKEDVIMGEDNMILVEIPPYYFHEIKNIGKDEMSLLVYCNEPFDSADPDTYYE